MAADPNWLLSSAAQSTAAIVAIAGGFITARLLGIQSERSGLESRLEEKRTEVDRFERELELARLQLKESRIWDFIDENISELRNSKTLPSSQEFRLRHEAESFDTKLFDEIYEKVKTSIDRAREFVVKHRSTISEELDDFNDWVSENRLDIGDINREEAEYMFQKEVIRKKEAREKSLDFGGRFDLQNTIPGLPIDTEWALRTQRRSPSGELMRDVESLSSKVRLLQGERDELNNRLQRLGYPPHFWIPLLILGYLAVVGVIFLLTQMPAETLDAVAKHVTIWGISFGLLALMLYLGYEFSRLKR